MEAQVNGKRPSLKRRSCEGEEDLLRPTDLVLRKNWKWLQFGGSPRFLCYRGPRGVAAPKVPVLLLNDSFLRFSSDYKSGQSELVLADMEVASKLCDMVSVGFDVEVGLGHSFSRSINYLLSHYFGRGKGSMLVELPYLEGDEDVAGGVLRGIVLKKGAPSVVIECRTDHDPWFQMLECVHQLFKAGESTSHVLGLCFSGVFVQAAAMVWDSGEGRVLAEPLSDYVCCTGPEDETLPKVASLLRAAKRFLQLYSNSDGLHSQVPWHIKGWHPVRLDDMVFLCEDHPRLHQVVVKFCKNYSEDAHRAWHKEDVAPELFEVVEIGCGWKMVVMEYLKKGRWACAADYAIGICNDRQGLERLEAAVERALERGHSSGYCHGDYRLENIMVSEEDLDQVKAVDFEFAGEASKAKYPRMLGDAIVWHPDAGFGKTLKPEHDQHFVSRIISDYYKQL